MARYLSFAALLSVLLFATQDALAKAPRPGMHHQPGAATFPAGNQAAMGGFGFGWSPFLGAPAYGPVIGYMPVYGIGTSGFVGSYGAGFYSTTFATPSFGGQSGFSSPAYGHWGGFGK
ncbi:MAG TPA: hypothetical protein VFI31_29315 [Pirellulales bacterium]|nr:hypothetical protein [Pirellulales bacterium]